MREIHCGSPNRGNARQKDENEEDEVILFARLEIELGSTGALPRSKIALGGG